MDELLQTFRFHVTLTPSSGTTAVEPICVDGAFSECSGLVLEADVILATERRYRSAPRVWDVHSAHRTFTALEAAVLGAAVVQRCGSDPAARAGGSSLVTGSTWTPLVVGDDGIPLPPTSAEAGPERAQLEAAQQCSGLSASPG